VEGYRARRAGRRNGIALVRSGAARESKAVSERARERHFSETSENRRKTEAKVPFRRIWSWDWSWDCCISERIGEGEGEGEGEVVFLAATATLGSSPVLSARNWLDSVE